MPAPKIITAEDFLEPRKDGGRMPARVVAAIDQGVAAGKATKQRKRLSRAAAAAAAQASATADPAPTDPAPFDAQGFASFISSWAAELDELPPHDREAVTIALRPYFAGRVMDAAWRDITCSLRATRRARMSAAPEPYENLNARGSPLRGGW